MRAFVFCLQGCEDVQRCRLSFLATAIAGMEATLYDSIYTNVLWDEMDKLWHFKSKRSKVSFTVTSWCSAKSVPQSAVIQCSETATSVVCGGIHPQGGSSSLFLLQLFVPFLFHNCITDVIVRNTQWQCRLLDVQEKQVILQNERHFVLLKCLWIQITF